MAKDDQNNWEDKRLSKPKRTKPKPGGESNPKLPDPDIKTPRIDKPERKTKPR